jgi:hypothetical protein
LNILRLVPTVRMNAQPSQRILATTWACTHAQSNAQRRHHGSGPPAPGLGAAPLAPRTAQAAHARGTGAAAARPRACARCAAAPAGRSSSTAAPASSWGRATKQWPFVKLLSILFFLRKE